MEMRCVPVVLFVFNRLEHVQKAVEALQGNHLAAQSELYIYSDGARNESDEKKIDEVRTYCRNITGFAEVHLIEREENWGIEKNEVEALNELMTHYEACIVLEDDLKVSANFLEYMNRALVHYKDEKKVLSIAGYSHIDEKSKKTKGQEFYFTQLTSSWGWATWADRWALFEGENINLEILKDKEEQRRFDIDGVVPYTQMLKEQIENQHITWDVAWYFKAFELGLLTLAPVCTMVNNIGMDGSGVHYCNEEIDSNRERELERAYSYDFPTEIVMDEAMRELEKQGLKKQQKRERRQYRIWKFRKALKGWLHLK